MSMGAGHICPTLLTKGREMADIIARIPNNQVDHFYNDKLGEVTAFWRVAGKPKRLEAGDYIFFTRPQGVVAGAKIVEITDAVMDSPDPSGKWNIVWDSWGSSKFEPPIKDIQYAGRGYRYLKPEEQERLRRAYKRNR